MSKRLLHRIIEVLEQDVLALTRKSVAQGNKIFGAAILDRTSLDLVVAGTNEETTNPLLHGEISTINRYWALPAEQRPSPADCLFISTHEPCSLCLSAITWSGFDNFYYLFTYQDSRDAFNIPHDLKIMQQVFGVADGDYQRSNSFWTSYSLTELIQALNGKERDDFKRRVESLKQRYDEFSATYQASKYSSDIPLA